MAKLTALFAAAFVRIAQPAAADPLDHWAGPIAEAASRFGLPEKWIRKVMRIESGGAATDAGRPIISAAGAMGLMQLMPETWRDMQALLGLGSNPFDPHDNILAGSAYLKMMYDRFGYPGMFAAYNAGPARYAAILVSRRRLPAETRAYMTHFAQVEMNPRIVPATRGSRLFPVALEAGRETERGESLFVRLDNGGLPKSQEEERAP